MKSTKFIKEIKRENSKYEIAKLKSFIKWKLSFGKKRKKREFSHSIFRNDHYWEREDPNALPIIILSQPIFCYMTLSLSKI